MLIGLMLARAACAGENSKQLAPAEPETPQPWRFALSLPAWIPWQSGDTGINGKTSQLKLGPNDIIPKLDMIATIRGEAHKGRFGILGEYSYMSLADGVGTAGLVKKLDVQVDQQVGELALSWRLLEGERGWLEVFGGVRYTNLYQALATQANERAINDASRLLVDTVAERVAAGVRERLGPLIQQRIANRLTALEDRDPVLPEGPIGTIIRGRVAQRIQAILAQRRAELQAAIQSGVSARVEQAKTRLAREIAGVLKDKLDTRVARADDWFDPFVGLRGRYYLAKSFYLTGRGDIGGFGVGADLSWQVNAGFGYQLTPNIFAETTYRVYDVDYRQDGLIYDVLTQGVEVTLGINF